MMLHARLLSTDGEQDVFANRAPTPVRGLLETGGGAAMASKAQNN
jgi:hypothetical protein